MTAAKVITCFLFVLPLAGCGKEYGELDRLDLTIAGPTSRRLSAFAAFRAAEGKLLTVDRYFNGEKQGETSRTLRLQDPSTNMWRAYDATGNWIEFRQDEEEGLFIERVHSPRYGGWVTFGGPLKYAPPTLGTDETHEAEQRFAAWSDKRTTTTGTIHMKSTFAGMQEIETIPGLVENCARVDSEYVLGLPYGMGARINQRQWYSPTFGEAIRDYDGTFKLIGIGLKGFTGRQVVTAQRPLTDEDWAAILHAEANPKPPPTDDEDDE
jgi:hypothetical protein